MRDQQRLPIIIHAVVATLVKLISIPPASGTVIVGILYTLKVLPESALLIAGRMILRIASVSSLTPGMTLGIPSIEMSMSSMELRVAVALPLTTEMEIVTVPWPPPPAPKLTLGNEFGVCHVRLA